MRLLYLYYVYASVIFMLHLARPSLDFEASHSDRWYSNNIFSTRSKFYLRLAERAGVLNIRKTSRESADAHAWPNANILRQSLCC